MVISFITINGLRGTPTEKKGVIYIFTNPSFPQYIKIGYATDVKQRLDELNSSTAVPFAFRIYATYEVDSTLSDKKLHSILDKLNPELQSTEKVDGKRRIRDFYAMTPEDALAQEINEQHQERLVPFAFSKCGIAIGEQIEFCCNGNDHAGTLCEVVDDKHVKYNGETWSLTALAKHLTGTKNAIAGPKHFKHKDEWLNDIRRRLGA